MKHLAKVALTSLILSAVCVSAATAGTCARLQNYADRVFEHEIVADLTSGAWMTSIDDKDCVLFFNEDGIVEVMTSDLLGDTYEVDTWMVISDCYSMKLMMSGPDEPMQTYTLEATCDGFAVVDESGEEGYMVKRHANLKRLVNRMREQITGTWESSGTSSRRHKVDLSWTFAENGTFAINTGPDRHHASYEGVWDITPDGTNIVLFFGNSENPEEIYARHLLKIHALDFEDMIMSGEPISNLLDVNEKKSVRMFFEKNYLDN